MKIKTKYLSCNSKHLIEMEDLSGFKLLVVQKRYFEVKFFKNKLLAIRI